MVSRVIPVEPFDLVVFGGTGDLARRKILPALYRRFLAGQMGETSRVIGAARSVMDAAGYRDFVRAAIDEFDPVSAGDEGALAAFLERLSYVAVDATGDTGWDRLAGEVGSGRIRAFYFSVGPRLFGALAERLHEYGMADSDSRIVVEKPFGRDLASARALNRALAQHFNEAPDLPDRSLSGQGDGAEPDGGALWQHAVRALVEQPVRRSHPDHRGRKRRGRRARRLLRQIRCDARHGAEPPDAAVVPDRDGTAREVRSGCGA